MMSIDGKQMVMDTEEIYKKERRLCIELGLDAAVLDAAPFDIYQLAEIRKGLESEIDVTAYLDASIPWVQMAEIRLELIDHLDMSVYRETGFDWMQLEEIRLGLEDKLDVAVYAKMGYLAAQMKEIRLGLLAGVPVSIYANPNYDWFQMEQIRLGLEHQVDVSLYADKEMTSHKMRQIREALETGIDIVPFLEYDAKILQQVIRASQSGVNILPFINAGFTAEALEEICIALEHGVNITDYLNPEFRGEAVHEIRIGLEERLQVELYANIQFNYKQMQEIRLGLEHRVNADLYAKPLYLWQQMREIRLGLEKGLDVESYSSMMYSPTDMKRMRLQLEEESEGVLPDYEELEKKVEISSRMVVSIGHNSMEAYLTLESGYDHKIEEIVSVLELQGIKKGIDRNIIEKMISNLVYDKPILIAKGKKPGEGKDGYYEFKVRGNMPRIPKELPDGSVDYQNIGYFEQVEAGQVLAIYHEAEYGEEGYDVLGNVIAARKGIDKPILTGKGFLLLEDKKTYVAAFQGKVEINGSEMIVSRLCVLEDVTLSTGNVKFPGSILVRGYVGSGVVLEADEDIAVEGNVEGATIRAKGNIMLKSGMMGNEKGCLEAEGKISGKFFESVTIRSRQSVFANYVMNCNIDAEGRVVISGNKGAIIGGYTQSVQGINAYQLGNIAEVRTAVRLGMTEQMMQEGYEIGKSISKVQGELRIFYEAKDKLMKKHTLEQLRTMDLFVKIFQAIEIKEQELIRETERLKSLQQKIGDNGESKAVIRGGVYPGTIVEIEKDIWCCKSMVKSVTIKKKGAKIALFAN